MKIYTLLFYAPLRLCFIKMPPCTSAGYFYHSSDLSGTVIADVAKSSTFAFELIEELFSNSHNLLVISFSVINYVVSMRRPRVSGEVSFFLVLSDPVTFRKPLTYHLDIVQVMHISAVV